MSSAVSSNICELFLAGTCDVTLHNASETCQEDIHQHSMYANATVNRRVLFNGFDLFTLCMALCREQMEPRATSGKTQG